METKDTNKEFTPIYFCTNCRGKVDNVKWEKNERNDKVTIGYCPKCHEEIVRKLITK
jgi:NAD-dependent SIR2 family protein deacetylase